MPVPTLPSRRPDAIDLTGVRALVEDFYARIHADALLGPVFERHVPDWSAHLEQMTAFWNGLLRGEPGFSGAPLARHLAIDGLEWSLFERWLALFAQSADVCCPPQVAATALERARRIAGHFWQHYQRRLALPQHPGI